MFNSSSSNATSGSILKFRNSMKEIIDFLNVAQPIAAVVGVTEAVLIIVPNALLLVTILSSPTLRSRMRNKLVLNLCLRNLILAVFICSIIADLNLKQQWVHGCYFDIVFMILNNYIQNCVASWGMVAMLGHYLCQLKNYPGPEFFNKVHDWVRRLMSTLCVVFPWVLAFVGALPVAIVGLDRDIMKYWSDKNCIVSLHKWAAHTEAALVYFVPSFVSIVLVVAILIVNKCGRVDRHSDELELRKAEVGGCLMNAETLEKPAVHVAAGLVTVALMTPEHIVLVWKSSLYRYLNDTQIILSTLVIARIEELFPIIVGLLWLLLLVDIRARFVELLGMLPCKCCSHRMSPESPVSSSPPVVFSDIADD